ncbi:alpha/beta hydrolase fold domain-containing protein [Streptomyces justiciae]|uniref:alpha/beta hydrolase fold domain-containing protein n=1 Tax=Streptomyces justiciae TaxID=2780140 RepID=UPI001D14C715|nr:alpha/beta hydrolase fold domain-containing protein [Streptomyces justiciae]
MRDYDDVPLWNSHASRISWDCYLGEGRRGTADVSPYAAPACAQELTGLPPAFVTASQYDPFRDEDVDYAQRLAQADVPPNSPSTPASCTEASSLSPRRVNAWSPTRSRHCAAASAYKAADAFPCTYPHRPPGENRRPARTPSIGAPHQAISGRHAMTLTASPPGHGPKAVGHLARRADDTRRAGAPHDVANIPSPAFAPGHTLPPSPARLRRPRPHAHGAAARLTTAVTAAGVPHDVKEHPAAGEPPPSTRRQRPAPLRPLRGAGTGPEPASTTHAWRQIDPFLGEHPADP